MEQVSIVRYWHAVELLQPQSAPSPKGRKGPYEALIYDTPINTPILPWGAESAASKEKLPNDRVWSHALYAHVYDSRRIAEKLSQVYGADQGYREPQSRESALFFVKFNMAGEMVNDSFVLSSEAWFLGRVLSAKDWARGFEDDQKVIRDQVNAQLSNQVSGDALRDLTQWILHFLGLDNFFGDMERYRFRFRSQPVKNNKPESGGDPLNSFLLSDLSDVADAIGKDVISEPLNQYLRLHDSKFRLNVDEDHASPHLIDRLMPDSYSVSCWPTERHVELVHSQQLAVNSILSTLADSKGLLGINGPPGTGKTTLLRDLIAVIVSSRADVLAKLGRASDGFVKSARETTNDNGREQKCYKLDPVLYGFEIVVASSNNGAVENITLELPQRDKIDESWLPDAEYFSEIGEIVSGDLAWGLISGALGSKARRTKFVDGYFYGRRPFGSEAKESLEAEREADVYAGSEVENIVDAQFPNQAITAVDMAASKDNRVAGSERKKNPKGLLGWLDAKIEVNSDRSPEDKKAIWQRAVSDYEATKAAARDVSANANRIRELVMEIGQSRRQIVNKKEALHSLEQELIDVQRQLVRVDEDESRPISATLKQSIEQLEQHQARKPGFWANFRSLWKTQRDWSATRDILKGQHDLNKADFERVARTARGLDAARQGLNKHILDVQQVLKDLEAQCHVKVQDASELAGTYQAEHLLEWLQGNVIGRGEHIELAEAWRIAGWRQARARVFIQALKLHKTFFELEAARLRSNLRLINAMLAGTNFRGISHDAIRSAWASLFMVVPVLSSTFASFARSFGSLGASDIGWLLVDEAGQATPQAAVGALWRSRRAVMVGDPLQLKPIINVDDAVLEHMRTHFRVKAHWLPNRQSAQTLADAATLWGRLAGPPAKKTWVGLPLVVHRRCDRPMYELANRIAYDGAMIYGTFAPLPGKETRASPSTGWIHVGGISQGNWVPAEGEALKKLLTVLISKDGVKAEDISVITPFKDVREQLKSMLDSKMVSGTIHTMQGKEAPVVIMVLGGNTEGGGARNWVVSEPNLLNVAATRAKRRFYVIGDRNDWKGRALFCDVMDLLPPQNDQIEGRMS